MTNFLNNALVYLFENIEAQTGYSFAEFVTNEAPNTTFHNQPYMQQYVNNTSSNQVYKYLYDPAIEFGFRFHQRIARIKYNDRKDPWITIIFNTGEKDPLTNLVSQKFEHLEVKENVTGFHTVGVKRVITPINLIFISNSMDYLYSFLGKLNFWFDRFVGYEYKQAIAFSNSEIENFTLTGQAMNITPKNLNKFDTEKRGSLATAGYGFDLAYWELELPEEGHILKHIDLLIKVVDNVDDLNLNYQFA